MLVLDFINVGNGDSILIREMEGARQTFAMLVDCGHDSLERDDHPPVEDVRSRRIYAGDFLKKHGVAHLDVLLLTHFHRDHVGGLGRVLEAATVGELLTPYAPPADAGFLDPDGDNGLPKAARNVLRCMDLYAGPPWEIRASHPAGDRTAGRSDGAPAADRGSLHGHPVWGACPVPAAEGGV